jgi:drug/metabolite transporter (DMT)-like permease
VYVPSFESVPARYRTVGSFVLLAALFGGSFVAIKTGLTEIPPLFFGGLRADIAALVLLSYAAVTRPRSAWLPRTRRDAAGIAVAGLFLVAANNAFLILGQAATTPAAASVMYGLNPVLAPLVAWWLLGQRLDAVSAAGIVVALAGVVLIVRPSPDALAAGGIGQALVLGAAVAVAVGSVGLRYTDPSIDSVPLTGWAMVAGAVVLHGASVAAGEPTAALAALSPAVVLAVVSLGVPSTAVAFVVYFRLIGSVGPVRANFVSYLVPVFAAVAGWAILGSSVSPWTAVGFAVVVVGFAIVERAVVREEFGRLADALGRDHVRARLRTDARNPDPDPGPDADADGSHADRGVTDGGSSRPDRTRSTTDSEALTRAAGSDGERVRSCHKPPCDD